ncbi:MAG: hypothetical protein HC882_07960 [Acidobacteria bacterium]|nr:hypothetical protein [Acidobacteriota bacterium]
MLHSNSGMEERDEIRSRPHVPLSQLLLQYRRELSALGLADPKKQLLGAGAFGVAYAVYLGDMVSVLKLTRDPYEVLSSCALEGKATEHIVPIFRVWSMNSTKPRKNWQPWFLIHRGYLEPVGGKDKEALERLFMLHSDEDLDLWLPRGGASGRGMREKWRAEVRSEYEGQPQSARRAMLLLDQISEAVRELRRYGIDWHDFHSDNMMRDTRGHLRIADVASAS